MTAQNAPPAAPIARIVPVESPVQDETLALVRRAALELQDTATREQRSAFLILELSPGSSPFHNCYALADFLTSEPFRNVTTVAWVPKTVTGYHALLALACNEIVLAPEAALGDLGSGKALSGDQQAIVNGIVSRRRNQLVTLPLVGALMDPRRALLQLTVENEDGMRETRLASEEEARQLREQGTVIVESKTIIESGTPGTLTGTQARTYGILAVRTASSRSELVDSYGVSLDALRELSPAAAIDKVAFIQLHDEIDEVFAAFAERQIDRAVASGAKLILFEIDSPGGLLWVCHDLSMKIAALSDREIRTVAYIPREAYSGGAILAVGCDEIYMTPDATIGNAIPINMMGNVILRAEEKALSGEMKLLRDLAKKKNRPAALLESFADKDLEVYEVTHKTNGRKWFMSADEIHKSAEEWEQGPRVPESRPGIALTVDGTRAHELMIAMPPVADLDALRQRLGIPADMELRAIERSWVDTLVFVLNQRAVTGLLFFLAIVFIYIEVMTQTGLFGILSALSFAIFFWSRVMGGTATGLEIALFAVGLGCLLMEFFVIPGFGVFGVSGILLVLGSLIMASQTFTGFDIQYDLARSGKTLATIGVSLLGVVVCAAVLSRYLPHIPLLREMVLTSPGQHVEDPDAPRLRPDLAFAENPLIGASGVALTILRPAGKARIEGQVLDVVSEGPFISEGTPVTVIRAARNHIVVREA